MSLHIEKAEYTLSELEANNYYIPIDIVYTNTSEKAIKYAKKVGLFYNMTSRLFTHKEGRMYVQPTYITGRLVWQGVDLFTGEPIGSEGSIDDRYSDLIPYIYGGGASIPDFPRKIEPGESIALTLYYKFSDTVYRADDDTYFYSNTGSMTYDSSSDEDVGSVSGTDSYNFDYSIGDDEEYLSVGLGSFSKYYDSSKDRETEEEIPVQTGYYSLVASSTVFVNCIRITEE